MNFLIPFKHNEILQLRNDIFSTKSKRNLTSAVTVKFPRRNPITAFLQF